MNSDVPRHRPKLIETPIPVTEISKASLADKNRKVGTIKNLHKWFAPMPTPALRAVIFSALVDEPDDPAERAELIELVKQLVPEDGTAPPEDVLRKAAAKIKADNPQLPLVLDPFAGSGSTLVEAQRLGLPVVGSDLNPVAVLIARTLAELLPPFVNAPAISPVKQDARLQEDLRTPFEGLAADLKYYGAKVQQAVEERVGEIYPKPPGGTPIAWLWARTVPCPNPGCPATVPLFSSPWLSKQKGHEAVVAAVAKGDQIKVVVRRGPGASGQATKLDGRAQFACPRCGEPFGDREIRPAGRAKNLGLQMLAACTASDIGRNYLSSDEVIDFPPIKSELIDNPADIPLIGKAAFNLGGYGFDSFAQLFTDRQLAVLSAFADEVAKICEQVIADGGDHEYARVITTLLGLCVSKLAQSNSALVRWRIDSRNGSAKAEPAFGTQAMPMLWDFAETYPFGSSVGSWSAQLDSVISVFHVLPSTVASPGKVVNKDARAAAELVDPGVALVVTDPPYFGQINYADLSDYFYCWMRSALRDVHPDLFATVATPKAGELVASPAQHAGSTETARQYFIDGFTEVFLSLQKVSRPDLPLLIVYAHKQDEREQDGLISTGWEALLEAVLKSGLGVVGTWPVEASSATKMIAQRANALASYVILVCRPRSAKAGAIDRRGLIATLREKIPDALRELQQAGIAPVDVAQAAIGPGMAVFSRYTRVNEPDGTTMRVRTALKLINDVVGEVQSEHVGDVSEDTRWCLEWFKTYGFDQGPFGKADQLARSKNTSIARLERAGVLRSRDNKVRLLSVGELPADYDPRRDDRVSEWEIVLHLAKCLREQGGDATARLMAVARSVVDLDAVRELAYLLFAIADNHHWTEPALLFNGLGTSWFDIQDESRKPALSRPAPVQDQLSYEPVDE